MDYVMTLDSVEPRPTPESVGHHGGRGWYLVNSNTVGAEALRVHVAEYAPGGYTEGHPIHMGQEHSYYILSGTMTLKMGGKEYQAGPGSLVFVPRGVEHNYRNDGQDNLVFLLITAQVRAGEVPPLLKRS